MDSLILLKLLSAVLLIVGLSFGSDTRAQDGNGGDSLESLQSQFRSKPGQPSSSADVVEAVAASSENRVWPGTTLEGTVLIRVADGWHINAHRPLQDFLIGTTLDIEAPPRFRVGTVHYPEPKLVEFGFSVEELAVYEGEVPVRFSLHADGNAASGQHVLSGEARVQACNDEICLRPSTIPVEIPIRVVSGG